MDRPANISNFYVLSKNKKHYLCTQCHKKIMDMCRGSVRRHYERFHSEVELPKVLKKLPIRQSGSETKIVKTANGRRCKIVKSKDRVRKRVLRWKPLVVQSLVNHVKINENLWNPAHRFYKDRVSNRKSWYTVANNIKMPKSEAILKWHTLHSSYRIHLMSKQDARIDQSPKEKKPNPVFASMDFLDSVFINPIVVPDEEEQEKSPVEVIVIDDNESEEPKVETQHPNAANNVWDYSLRKMEPLQALIAGKLISTILIQGQLGLLEMNSCISTEDKTPSSTYNNVEGNNYVLSMTNMYSCHDNSSGNAGTIAGGNAGNVGNAGDNAGNVGNAGNVRNVRSKRSVRNVRTVDSVRHVRNVDSIRHVRTVDSVRHVRNVDTVRHVRTVDNVRHVRTVDTVRHVRSVDNIRNVRSVDNVRNVRNVDNLRNVRRVRNVSNEGNVRNVRNVRNVGIEGNDANERNVDSEPTLLFQNLRLPTRGQIVIPVRPVLQGFRLPDTTSNDTTN